MHGIRSETGGLVRAERDDFMAAAYLAEFVDRETLAAILSNKRSRNAMNVIQAALASRVVRDNYSVTGVGYLRYEDRDAIPQAADFLLTEENVHTAIVYRLVIEGGREMIIGSLRTKKATLNPDAFLKEALGGPQAGRYYGGGRREALRSPSAFSPAATTTNLCGRSGGFTTSISSASSGRAWAWRRCGEPRRKPLQEH